MEGVAVGNRDNWTTIKKRKRKRKEFYCVFKAQTINNIWSLIPDSKLRFVV